MLYNFNYKASRVTNHTDEATVLGLLQYGATLDPQSPLKVKRVTGHPVPERHLMCAPADPARDSCCR